MSQAVASLALENQLADNPSPYLALHSTDPVAWQEWNEDILERAKAEKKLIFLSIGYFSCHWCHVMQRESYKDKDVAQWLNKHFIPVKIDRELEEALDARMISFAEKTQGRAGWPLNVFVTPEGYPLYAALYLPRDNFLQLITKLQGLWVNDTPGMMALAREDSATESLLHSHQWSKGSAAQLVESLTNDAHGRADQVQGGFGEQTKFPSTPQLDFLLDSYHRQPSAELKNFLTTTLDQMAALGLRDHIGGGFFRYTTDPDWHTPHFEKMLYDNAQLARVYLRAADVLQRPDYREVVSDTLQFMQLELLTDEGAMVGSLSALDAAGVEGGYYLWSADELINILTPDERRVIESTWLGKSAAPFDAGYLPIWQQGYAMQYELTQSDRKLLESARQKLLQRRQQHRQIPVDDKLLAGWNGLALSAFSLAYKELGDAGLKNTAGAIARYIRKSLVEDGNLIRASREGKPIGQASLADYAYVAEGFWHYYLLTGSQDDMNITQSIIDAGWEKFYSSSGWNLGAMAGIESAGRQAIIADGPQASASSVLLDISYQLAKKTGDKQLGEKVQNALGFDALGLSRDPFWYASQVGVIADVFLDSTEKSID
jgi:uncharacterized protein YyaL (SSP411 family)